MCEGQTLFVPIYLEDPVYIGGLMGDIFIYTYIHRRADGRYIYIYMYPKQFAVYGQFFLVSARITIIIKDLNYIYMIFMTRFFLSYSD